MGNRRGGSGSGEGVRVLIAAGGTGGHVYPGLAVAEALRVLAPAAEIRFAGRPRGLEGRLVPAAGYRLHRVPASGFRGLGTVARLRFAANLAVGWAAALLLQLRWRPSVVLGTGGYASAPTLAAARTLRRPAALQEQNAVPGSANRLLARWVDRIYLGTGAAQRWFAGRDCLVTGNPVRAAFLAAVPARDAGGGADSRGIPPNAPGGGAGAAGGAQHAGISRPLRVLVFGGSRGARTLNRAVAEAAPLWRDRPGLALRLQTGADDLAMVQAAYTDWPAERALVEPYIEDMASALLWADLAICRAGAMTLAELAAVGRPAILVPFPHATDDHQLGNAQVCADAGAAVVLRDEECSGATLAAAVDTLGRDRDRLVAMGRASAGLARPDAAERIARDLLRLAGVRAPDGRDSEALEARGEGHVS